MTSETMIKSAGAIEQKGVAQLLQIEEVRLKSSRRCGFIIIIIIIIIINFYKM